MANNSLTGAEPINTIIIMDTIHIMIVTIQVDPGCISEILRG